MTRLEDEVVEVSPARVWLVRGGIAIVAILVLALLIWAAKSLVSGQTAPKRQTVKIAVLPDTPPPPPPPPPKEEKKQEQKQEQQQVQTPKQEAPPEPQQLKMEGPAGDGPSPFAGGEVHNDYIGGDIGNGDARERYASYAGRLSQQLQADLSRRNLKGAGAKVLLWLAADGTIQRYKLLPTGDEAFRHQLETAFEDIKRVGEAPPSDMPMPVGLDVNVQ